MSSSTPMYALDKVKTSLLVQVEVFVKLSTRAKEKHVPLAAYMNTVLFANVQHDPWTEADEKERQKIIQENMRKRAELKAKKGIK